MSGAGRREHVPSSSSSSQTPVIVTPASSGDRDDEADGHLLHHDPIRGDLSAPLSFKRKQKPALLSNPLRAFSTLTGSSSASSPPRPQQRPPRHKPSASLSSLTSAAESLREQVSGGGAAATGSKDGIPNDWYAEGPGRRVAYEDLTAIDWIFEYTKERQRLRVLSSSSGGGIVGYVRHLLDASQVWIVLLLTGLAVGVIAALIDITTDWLGDIKLGFCASGPEGGHFYLNKNFCCYGYDQGSKCAGWRFWSEALGIRSAAGKWFIEYFFFLAFGVLFAYCAALLVQEYAIHAKHSGIPEIKTVLGGFVIRKFLGPWTLVTKSFGLVLAVSSGMWLGKEGPLVHVACCCANVFIKLFSNINDNEGKFSARLEPKQQNPPLAREVLSAAAASGISVAFGAPIGGVLFSLEQISYFFPDKTMWQSFVCAMAAAVILQAFDPFRSGKLVMYQTKYSHDWRGFEILPYAILGITGGIYGGLFIKANMAVARWKKAKSWLPSPIIQVLAVAFLTALVNYPNHYMKFQASDLVSNLFTECSQNLDDQIGLCKTGAASAGTIVLLIFAALVGFLLATITFGLQIPAGIILPSMAIGALVGRAMGILMEIWVDNARGFFLFKACTPDAPCITPATYAIVGASAALAGVTRMTVSIVVIMFELTGALTYVLPIMVAVMISKWVGDAFSRRGIYESWIHFNEYPFLDNSEEVAIPDVPVADIMTRIEDLVVLTASGHTMASLGSVLEMHPYRGFPVISDPRDAILLGYISRAELSYNLKTASQSPRNLPPETEAYFSHQPLADPRTTLDLRPWMDQTPLTLPSRTSLHLVVSYFQKLGLRYMLFTDRGVLQGLLTKKDIWYVLNGADETRRTSGLSASAGTGSRARGQESGIMGEGRDEEQRGLLRTGDDVDDTDRGSIL
ncbi:chloride channel 3 [Trichoderma cornu-damae]|uniref:Chloride channel protein n=1 Tax=Trichoderma cornu-damae TaxID=654480 RepID=A0A9P8QG95_9HYPO|nr:chloride channel 3 [Trichoderma cornu-damae]